MKALLVFALLVSACGGSAAAAYPKATPNTTLVPPVQSTPEPHQDVSDQDLYTPQLPSLTEQVSEQVRVSYNAAIARSGLVVTQMRCVEDGATLHFACVGTFGQPPSMTIALWATCSRELQCVWRNRP